MTAAVKNILAQIDTLNEREREELEAELRLRAYLEWDKLVDVERARSRAEGLTEAEVDRLVDEAVHEIRYGANKP